MDKIKIINNNGISEEMEIVLDYEYNDNKFIIYKDKKNNHYIAKCDDKFNLDTELNTEEIEYGEEVLKGVIDEITSK